MDETINWLRDMWKPISPYGRAPVKTSDNVVKLPRAAQEPVVQTAPLDYTTAIFGDGNVVNAETVFSKSAVRSINNFIWFLKFERESGYNVANSDIVRGETLLRIATKREEARKWKEPKWGTGPAMIALDDMKTDQSVWSFGEMGYQAGRDDLASYTASMPNLWPSPPSGITITGIRDIPDDDGPRAA